MAKRDFGATLILLLTLNKAIAWSFSVIDDCVMAADVDNLTVINSQQTWIDLGVHTVKLSSLNKKQQGQISRN